MYGISWVVPFRPTADLWRERCWRWNRERGETLLDGLDGPVEIVTGDRPGPTFSHAAAFNAGVERATGDLLVLTDTDTTVDLDVLANALDLVDRGVQPWAMASSYAKLTRDATGLLLRSAPSRTISDRIDLDRDTEWVGRSWAGFLVIRRDDYLAVGGYDERITGWGADDGIMGATLSTLLGSTHRIPGHVWHLWHDNAYEREHGMSVAETALVAAYTLAEDVDDVRRAMEGKP